jgi:hypothetical protein
LTTTPFCPVDVRDIHFGLEIVRDAVVKSQDIHINVLLDGFDIDRPDQDRRKNGKPLQGNLRRGVMDIFEGIFDKELPLGDENARIGDESLHLGGLFLFPGRGFSDRERSR